MGGPRNYWTVLVILLLLGGVMAASGCLDGDDDDDEKELVVPDDRKGEKLTLIGGDDVQVTIEEIVKMGPVDFEATFVNSVGTTYTANYTGVLLTDLLELANPSDDADVLWVTASDGYRAMLFLGDVDDTTYIALLEDDEWNDIDDAGVFRLVDTDLPSSYWVRAISSIAAVVSSPLWSGGYTEEKWLVDVGWLKEHASKEVSWTEGEKTRTYTGVPMSEVLTAVGADGTRCDTLGLGTLSELYAPVDLAMAREDGVLLVDSRGDYVYYQGPEDQRVEKVQRFYVGTLVTIDGEVGDPYSMDALALSDNDQLDVPWVNVTYNGQDYVGTPLSWLVAQAAPDSSADAVRVVAGDGYFAVFPISDLTGTALAFMEDDGDPVALDLGPFRIVDGTRPGPYQVSWVVELDVFSSYPVDASGSVNVTDVLDVGYIAASSDTAITYNDGKKDRTYAGLTWDAVLSALDADTTATTIRLVDADEDFVEWDVADLLGRTDSGICVDSRGNYVAYNGDAGEAFPDLVSIVVT